MSQSNDFYRLWQHDNGYWYVIWSESNNEGPDKRGSKRISTGRKDRREAEQYRAQFIAGLANAKPEGDEPMIRDILDKYRNEKGVNTRSLDTIDRHIKALKEFFGDLFPSHLSNSLFREYAGKQTIGPGTLLRRLGVLKAALRYAEGERWIERQPKFSMPVQAPPPKDLWLTRDEATILLEKVKTPHIRLFINIAISTAARSGAILDLKWSQIDFEKRLINFGQGYGNKRRVIAPMNDDVYEALLKGQELAVTQHVIEFNGKAVGSIKKAFRVLCKECGIKASPHVLRHTAATWMVMAGVPLSEVARLLGDSEKTVEKVYGHHAPDYLRRAVGSLNLMVRNKPVLQL